MHSAEGPSAIIPTRTRKRAMDWSLVLASQDIAATIASTEEHRWALLIERDDYDRAIETIRRYEEENRHWHWGQPLPWSSVAFHWGALVPCLVLILIHQASWESPPLRSAWIFDTTAVRSGQWWRGFTAVLLHADVTHLFANVTSGALLLGLAMARFGAGCALTAALLSGALANFAGLIISGRHYTGLGASGAIMGALGMVAFQNAALWRANPSTRKSLVRGIAAGVLLFVILGGTNPESDVVAHLGGFVVGAAFGTLLSFLPNRVLADRRFVTTVWLTFIALLIGNCAAGLFTQ